MPVKHPKRCIRAGNDSGFDSGLGTGRNLVHIKGVARMIIYTWATPASSQLHRQRLPPPLLTAASQAGLKEDQARRNFECFGKRLRRCRVGSGDRQVKNWHTSVPALCAKRGAGFQRPQRVPRHE